VPWSESGHSGLAHSRKEVHHGLAKMDLQPTGTVPHGATWGDPVVTQLRGDDPRGKAHPPGMALAAGPHLSELAMLGGERGEDRGRLVGGKGYGGWWRIPTSACAREEVRYGVDVEAEKKRRLVASLTVKGPLWRRDDGRGCRQRSGIAWQFR
jgi:hypothetical protein